MAMLRQQKIQDSQKHSSELFDCLTILCTQSVQTYITSLDCMLMIGCVRTCQIFQRFRTQGPNKFQILDDCDFCKISKFHWNAYQFRIFDDCDFFQICKIHSNAYQFWTLYDRDFCKTCKLHSKKKETVLCVFLGASVMGDLMSLHAEMSQSRVSTYFFHSFHKSFINGQQS